MKAEIIAVGNEVVDGYVINTNASYIAKQLSKLGIETASHRTVRDDEKVIKTVVNEAVDKYDYVVLTGGLGPTKDDLTKEAVCDALKKPLILNHNILRDIEQSFINRNKNMPKINIKQAMFPEDAYILKNEYGTAPGCVISHNNSKIVLLPGPPSELKIMVEEELVLYINNRTKMDNYIETLDIKLFGISESLVVEIMTEKLGETIWENTATYVGENEIIVRITKSDVDREKAKDYIYDKRQQIEKCFENNIIGYNEDKVEDNIVKLLLEKSKTIATIESCTGGMLAETLINCGGVSACFNEGVITYSNEAKIKYADVSANTLNTVGAVSEETAVQMAEGIKKVSGADIGLSTTGIAGPGGGSKDKPVGLVYIAIAMPKRTYVYQLNLTGSRRQIRELAVKNVLFNLLKLLR